MRRSRAHLVLDSERRQQHAFLQTIGRNNDKREDAANQFIANQKKATAQDNGRPITALEAVLGNSLSHHEIMRRVVAINHNLRFELSPVTGRFGVYCGAMYLGTSIERGISPEFTPVLTNADGSVSTGGVRPGYRNALAKLIRSGYITESQCAIYFGQPSHSSERWAKALGKVR